MLVNQNRKYTLDCIKFEDVWGVTDESKLKKKGISSTKIAWWLLRMNEKKNKNKKKF